LLLLLLWLLLLLLPLLLSLLLLFRRALINQNELNGRRSDEKFVIGASRGFSAGIPRRKIDEALRFHLQPNLFLIK